MTTTSAKSIKGAKGSASNEFHLVDYGANNIVPYVRVKRE